MSISKDYPYIKSKDDPLLEEQNGYLVGKHPDNVQVSEMKSAGHINLPLAKIIRKKCLECTGFQKSEIRKCTATACALWPYRMGKNPFQSAKNIETRGGCND